MPCLWRLRLAESVEFGGNARSLPCPDALEDLQRLPQADLGFGGPAGGQGTAAQAGE